MYMKITATSPIRFDDLIDNKSLLRLFKEVSQIEFFKWLLFLGLSVLIGIVCSNTTSRVGCMRVGPRSVIRILMLVHRIGGFRSGIEWHWCDMRLL